MFPIPVSLAGKILRGAIYVIGAMLAALVASPHLMGRFGDDGKEFLAVALAGLIALRGYIDTSAGDRHPEESAAALVTRVGETAVDTVKQEAIGRAASTAIGSIGDAVERAGNALGAASSPLPEPAVLEEQPLEPHV